MMQFPQLETERLVLRLIDHDDREAVLGLFGNAMVTEHLDIEPLATSAEAERLIDEFGKLVATDRGIRWGIELKENGALIGTAGYNFWTKARGARGEIGYDLLPAYWGCGLMAEALGPVLRFGFENRDLNRIEAMVNVGNERSMHLLRRLGFQHEGVLREYGYWRGRFWDQCLFALLRREWAELAIDAGRSPV